MPFVNLQEASFVIFYEVVKHREFVIMPVEKENTCRIVKHIGQSRRGERSEHLTRRKPIERSHGEVVGAILVHS